MSINSQKVLLSLLKKSKSRKSDLHLLSQQSEISDQSRALLCVKKTAQYVIYLNSTSWCLQQSRDKWDRRRSLWRSFRDSLQNCERIIWLNADTSSDISNVFRDIYSNICISQYTQEIKLKYMSNFQLWKLNYLALICVLNRPKKTYIQRLKKVRDVSWQTHWNHLLCQSILNKRL